MTTPEEDFERDGVVCLRDVFEPHWIETLARGVERNLAEPSPLAKRYTPDGKPGLFLGDYCSWRRIPEYADFLRNSPAAAIAGRFMQSRKINLFHEHVLVKEPGTLEPTPWHHDLPYWTLEGTQACSLWIPLDPVTRETSVEYVAGSHKWGAWYTPKRFSDGDDHDARDDRLQTVPDIDANRGDYTLLGWDMRPGDCILFNGLVLHGAPGNRSANRRRAFAARFTGDDVRYALRPGYMSPPPHGFPGAPQPGQPMDSEAFPVVWRADGAVAA
jgi:ectoine hydroxylase-related dioxygenase (phytanoyl-CoA dioxygenase family)